MNTRRILLLSSLSLLALELEAAPITIRFEFRNVYAEPMADGAFTFDGALDGRVLSYADLSAFRFHFAASGASYDLGFVNSGHFQSPYLNFEFDTASDRFLFGTADAAASPLAAIKAGYKDGFWVGINSAIGDYSSGASQNLGLFSSVSYGRQSLVPEPAMAGLLGLAVACAALARRRGAGETRPGSRSIHRTDHSTRRGILIKG